MPTNNYVPIKLSKMFILFLSADNISMKSTHTHINNILNNTNVINIIHILYTHYEMYNESSYCAHVCKWCKLLFIIISYYLSFSQLIEGFD